MSFCPPLPPTGETTTTTPTKPVEEKDFNPDHNMSTSGLFIEEKGNSVLYAMKVRQAGAIVMRASVNPDGTLEFKGVSIFTDREING